MADCLAQCEETTKRLEKLASLGGMFGRLIAAGNADGVVACYLVASGRIAPPFEGTELGLGAPTVIRALAEFTGVPLTAVRARLKALGDLGSVAGELFAHKQRQAVLAVRRVTPLTVERLMDGLKGIAELKGAGSGAGKLSAVKSLLSCCASGHSMKYVVRILCQEGMRIGVQEATLQTSLCLALGHRQADAQELVRNAFEICCDVRALVPVLLATPPSLLASAVAISPGTPVRPMLASPVSSVDAVFQRLTGPFVADFKYDGERCQLHYSPARGAVHLFSRHLERSTGKFPEIAELLCSQPVVTSDLIMDGEIVLLDCTDPANPSILPFQQLSRRTQWQHQASSWQIAFVAFDLLFHDGQPLVSKPISERKQRLHHVLQPLCDLYPNRFILARSKTFTPIRSPQVMSSCSSSSSSSSSLSSSTTTMIDVDSVTIVAASNHDLETSLMEDVQSWLQESIDAHTEGLIAKDASSPYYMNKRGFHWLKMKRDYLDSLADSIDVLVVGAFWGTGRRAQWFGAFLLAVRDPGTETFQTLCKCMTGYTDKFMQDAVHDFPRLERKPAWLHTAISPSVWLDPGGFRSVWEVRGADLTLSLTHTAALGCIQEDPSRGLSLRFPRFLRIRDDKTLDGVSTSADLLHLYRSQTSRTTAIPSEIDSD
ncbi:MAG: ATP-dependent DNA ligase [archaeon]|nr:ATP-dependent DNA ligase [archaeon]